MSRRKSRQRERRAEAPRFRFDVSPKARWVLLGVLGTAYWGLLAFVAHHDWTVNAGFFRTHSRAISGDEPHYLVVLNSLLFDGDLDVHADYRRIRQGGWEAGELFRGELLDYHTIVVNRATRRFYRANDFYDWSQVRPCGVRCEEFVPRRGLFEPGAVLAEIPIHPPAYPAVLAAMVAPFRPKREQVEAVAGQAMVLISWVGVVLTVLLGRAAKLHWGASVIAATLVGIASPALPYARSFFSEPLAMVFLTVAAWAMLSRFPILAGLCVGVATAIKPPFAIIGAVWLIERWVSKDRATAWRLLAALAASAIALVSFNWWLGRMMLVSVHFDYVTPTLIHLFSERYGLFLFVPWTLVAAYGLRWTDELLRLLLWPVAVFALMLFVKGDPGWSYGPRFFVPFLPMLGVAAMVVATRVPVARRALLPLAIVGAAFAIPAALKYPAMFRAPPYVAWTRPLTVRPEALRD